MHPFVSAARRILLDGAAAGGTQRLCRLARAGGAPHRAQHPRSVHVGGARLRPKKAPTHTQQPATMSKTSLKLSPKQQKEKKSAAAGSAPVPTLKDVANVPFDVLPPPTKSERDKKEYKVIRLGNGLTACLISDKDTEDEFSSGDYESESDSASDLETESEPESEPERVASESDNEVKKMPEVKHKMAAAGLCVGVGSFSDPPEIPGMAHFLEHMVFMGSERFPEENDFDRYISKRGGSDNASTDCETTTFYFECLEKYLYRSLDKFAQFFIAPLMKRESMTREREAIDSEFQMAIPNDAYRKEQLLASLFNPHVPVNQFTWGNLVTLKEHVGDEQLYAALHAFRRRHYSAHRMTLCVQARLPIDTLQAFVLDCFRHVPTNGLPPVDFRQYSDAIYDTPDFNKLYYIIPNKNSVSVDLIWALPSLLHLYKSKPHQYVSWLLGDEGRGSLIAELRRRVWALAIFTGNGETGSEHNTMYAYFTVTIVLTQAGLQHLYDVIDLVFSYVNLLKKVGPQERIFKEIQLIDETSFTFADETPAVEMVENLAESMQFYPSEDYLTGSEIFTEYRPDAIQMVLNHLRPDKVNIMVLDKNMPSDVVCDQVEPWFKTLYTTRDIPNACLERWTNAEPLATFSLPEPNRFLTTQFGILSHPGGNPAYPTRIVASKRMELWYRFDEKFRMPAAYYYYYLISPMPLESPTNSCMLDMFLSLLTFQLTEEAYPAQVAGLEYSFAAADKGINIRLSGYNEKLPVLLELITRYVRDVAANLTEEMFDAVKESQAMMYYNKFLKPSSLNKDLRLSLLLSAYWPPIEKHAAVAKVSFEMMRAFSEQFIRTLYVQGLVQGNVDERTARDATNKFVAGLQFEPLLENTFPKIRVVQLPTSEHCLRCHSFNKNDTNSYITNYYQAGPFNIKTHVIIEILMMIIEEPLFDVLRTKEQLGYNVFCNLRDTFGILGYSITVNTQAAKYTTQHVDQRIEAFVKHVQKLLKKMPEKKMNTFKRDLVKVKQVSDVLLKEEVSRNWAEITSREYLFDRLQQEIRAIEELKASDIRKFWEDHNVHGNKSSLRKLSIQVIGAKAAKEAEVKLYNLDKNETQSVDGTKSVYSLELIGAQKEWNEKPADGYFIRNIDEFKQNLFLFPHKTSNFSSM